MTHKFVKQKPLASASTVLTANYYPTANTPPKNLYARVDSRQVASLRSFRQQHPLQSITVAGVLWKYIMVGEGSQTILFLHGLTGAYDLWWQQIEALKETYRTVSVTYPGVNSLDKLAQGLLAILQEEDLKRVTVVGSSLGGYLAQYLVARHPEVVARAVLANTFPPNDLIARQYRLAGAALPYAPEWLVMAVLRYSFKSMIYPAAGEDELVLAYLREITYGVVSKAQIAGRYRCAIELSDPPDISALGVPVLVLEASNDPLINKVLREKMRITYPSAQVINMGEVGHFAYLNQPRAYTTWLQDFFSRN